MKRIRLLVIVGLLNAAQPADAGSTIQSRGAAALEIRWQGAERVLELADLIVVTLTVEGPEKLATPMAPLLLGGDAKWQLVKRSEPSRESFAPKQERWRLVYHFAPAEPGKIAFTFPAVKYRLADGVEKTATWDAVEFTVTAPAPGGLRDDSSIEGLPPLPPPDPTWWIASAVVGGLFVVIGVLVVARRWLRRAAPRTPAQLALDAWRRLMAKKLHENGRSGRFITLLTMIVRRYLERQLSLPARRRTTPEFLQQLDSCTLLTDDERQFLRAFFERCDAVKFAQSIMRADECRELADAARQFLERHPQS